MEDKLCVKWNDNLQERLHTSFEKLRDDNDFTDVTLACEDQSVKAHKVILSASSPFFHKLLKYHPHPQPLVYMRGVKAEDLIAMIDFIYLGEASIVQEQLERFLAFAEELELKGISNGRGETAVEYRTTVSDLKGECLNNKNQRRTTENMEKITFENLFKIKNVKSEKSTFEGRVEWGKEKEKQTATIDPETKAKVASMIERRAEGLFACTECQYTSKISCHMKEHVEKHIEGLEYPCKSCGKVLKTSLSWRSHRRNHH